MMDLCVLPFVFLLVFHDLLYRCDCEILWKDLETECQPQFQSENLVNIAHSVNENKPIGSIIYDLSIDFGSGSLFFEGNLNRRFAVVNDTGVIVVNDLLDFESNPTEVMDIIVFNKTEGNITNVHLVVHVLDVDEPPFWTMFFQPYKAQFTLNNDVNDVVYQLSAVDPENENNTLVYGLFSDEYNLFHVNSATGEISLKARPSADILAEHILRITVTVTEKDKPGNRNAADIFFYTSLQPPQFTHEGYTIDINEDSKVPVVLTTVKARSFQSDGIISYSIMRQPDDIHHSIDELGAVKVLSNLDREYRTGYTILVKATDSLDQVKLAEVMVLINDVNDNSPAFSHNVYTYTDVQEDHNITEPIGTVKISDPDADSNGTYYLSCDSDLFRVDQWGDVYSLVQLDYETHHQHRFQVTATDLRGRFSCAYIVISVKNIPDEKPQFSKPFYQFEVDRSATVGYHIGQVFAHDPDGNAIKFNMKYGTASPYFDLNKESGILSLVSAAEELEPSHTMIVEVVEAREVSLVRQGLESVFNPIGEVSVKIITKDINQHTPEFPHCSGYSPVHVYEEQETVTFVCNVTAVDSDKGRNGEVVFSLNDHGSQAFKIETKPGGIGTIRTRKSLDRELRATYTVTVIVKDQATYYPLRNTCTINIIVDDINDNEPRFDHSRYTRTLDRNVEVGTALLTVQAEDPDDGDNVLRYSLTNPSDYFGLLNNGTMILRKSLGSLTKLKFFSLEAQATDSGGRYGKTQIVFEIVDTAHRLPTWNKNPFPEQTVSEEVVLNEKVFAVKATSYFTSTSVTYTIVRGLTPATNSLKNFYINVIGEVQVDGNLDYESVQTYKLKIMACDAAPAPNCAYRLVIVRVEDVNDGTPTFLVEDNLSVNVVEGPVTDDAILQLEARDSDISSQGVSYSTVCDNNDDCASFFMVRGLIRTHKTAFDREIKAEYRFKVKAEDNSPTSLAPDVRQLTINILDINDNIPVFQNSSYSVVISEDTMVDTTLLSISATDADNDEVEHFIVGGTTGGAETLPYKHDTFRIDSFTGSIVLSSKLDFEVIQWYQLTYAATDGVHEVTTSLHIQVTDVNDNAPKFSQQKYETTVDEGTDYTETTLFTVDATEDVVLFGSVVYSLYGVPDGTFSIDPLTGNFAITRQLDHEHKSEWNFLVVATYADGAGLSSAADVVIRVQDINDNAPVFLNPTYIGEIYEGRPVGSFVMRISATDDDVGDYANLVYTLSSPPKEDVIFQDGLNGLGLFNVETSGDITTRSVFDRELNSTYFLEVIATDMDSNATGSCTVTISILDNNDNIPTVVQEVFSTEISERVVVGYSVASVYAHDADIDENAQLSFSIVGDEASSFFVDVNPVNKQNGIVRVKKNLDYQIKSNHNISIDVTQATFTRRVSIMVRLTDVNDYFPKFSEKHWNISVSEDTLIGSNLLNITATDSDPGFNGVIRYHILQFGKLAGMFDINNTDGSLYLRKELDREKKESHTIYITARDQGSPSLSATTTVNIHVTDVNDNSPMIHLDHQPVISETVTPPYEVVLIEALDLDAPHNQGPFSFEMVCSDAQDVCDHFTLTDQHDNTSILYTKTRLDSKVKSEYVIQVRIKDSGDPPQSNISSITVTITPADSDGYIIIIIGASVVVGVFLLLGCICVICYKQRKRCSLRKSYDVAGYTQTYQSFTLGLRGGLLRVGGSNDVDMHRRKLARRSLSESDHGMHGQNSFGMEMNNLCLSDDKLTTLCEGHENIDREFYRSDSSLDMASTMSFSVETKTSKWVDESRARTLRQSEHMTDYNSQPPPVFTFRTQHRVFRPTYV